METYVARQPIFDRNMKVYGYELLYRRSSNNYYEGIDDNQATIEVIKNAFLVFQFNELTDGTKAFINFSEELLEKEIPLLLPKEKIVVEILERVRPTESVIRACHKLKKKGYILALDDFVFHESYTPLIQLADIIKVEFPVVDYHKQRHMIQSYNTTYPIQFLAEKVESREEHRLALDMGYDLFQGYFYSKPVLLKEREIKELQANTIRIINELNQEEPNYQIITEIIEKDLGLSYKILKVVNSVFYASRYKIYSIKQALVRLGIEELKKWVHFIMLKEVENVDNRELIKTSLIRAKLMELLSKEMGMQKHFEFFITGMFSSIDILLQKEMGEIVNALPFTNEVREALLGKNNDLRWILDFILCFELADWESLESQRFISMIDKEAIMPLYIQALNWARELNY